MNIDSTYISLYEHYNIGAATYYNGSQGKSYNLARIIPEAMWWERIFQHLRGCRVKTVLSRTPCPDCTPCYRFVTLNMPVLTLI